MTTYHPNIVNTSTLRRIHLPGYVVADASARAALTDMQEGDLCYQQDTDTYYVYDGSSWDVLGGADFSGFTDCSLVFVSSGSPDEDAAFYWDDTNKRLIVGDNAYAVSTTPKLCVARDGGAAGLGLLSYNSIPYHSTYRANGSKAFPTAVASDDVVGQWSAGGYANSAWQVARAYIKAVATESWTAAEQGLKWLIQATRSGTLTLVDALTVAGERVTIGTVLNLQVANVYVSGNAITAVSSYMRLTGEGGIDDYLDTINGGSDGDIIILKNNGLTQITFVGTVGNIEYMSPQPVLVSESDRIMFMYDGNTATWIELCRNI